MSVNDKAQLPFFLKASSTYPDVVLEHIWTFPPTQDDSLLIKKQSPFLFQSVSESELPDAFMGGRSRLYLDLHKGPLGFWHLS